MTLSHSIHKWFLRFYFIKVWEPRHCVLVSTSWHPGVAPCMHGALSTQELKLHAIQFWGDTAKNKGLSGLCFQMVAPGPGVSGGTQLLYLQAKTQWAQAIYSVLFCSATCNVYLHDIPVLQFLGITSPHHSELKNSTTFSISFWHFNSLFQFSAAIQI